MILSQAIDLCRRPVALMAASLAVSACAPSYTAETELARLDGAPLCCTDAGQIPVSGVLEKEMRISLTSAAPVFLFPSGRSYGYGFALPAITGPYQLEMAALPMARTVFKPSGHNARQYLYPALFFLDADHKAIVDEYDHRLVAECPAAGCKFELTGRVAPPANARYAVLHTPYRKIGVYYSATVQSRRGLPGDTGKALIYPGSPMEALGQFVAVGDVVVRVRMLPKEPASKEPQQPK